MEKIKGTGPQLVKSQRRKININFLPGIRPVQTCPGEVRDQSIETINIKRSQQIPHAAGPSCDLSWS